MVRKALLASLALAPITIGLHYLAHPSETVEFVLAAISLIPLAWLAVPLFVAGVWWMKANDLPRGGRE